MFNRIPDVSRFPVRISHDHQAMGIGLAVFAVGTMVMAAYGDLDDNIIVWLLVVIGLLAGIVLMIKRDLIEIDRGTVTVRKRSLTELTTWSEPLADFQGVLRRVELTTRGREKYRLYNVELRHPEKDKSLLLYKSRKEKGIRALWETAARTFELPALEAGEQGMVERQVADLDKSIQKLAREDRHEDDFDASRAPPKGITWRRGEDRLVVSVRLAYSRDSVWIVAGLALVVAIAALLGMAAGFFVGELPVVIFFIVIFVPAAAVAAWMVTAGRLIVITPSTLRISGRWLCGPYPADERGEIAVAEIETVIRRPDVGSFSEQEELRIESDAMGITVGPLVAEQGRWLESFILSATIGAPGERPFEDHD